MSAVRQGLRFVAELRRRRVFRVAAWYGATAWLLIQVAANTFAPLGLPPWTVRATIVACIGGFPIALVLAWYFDLNPDGVRIEDEVADATPGAGAIGWSVWLGLAAGVLLGIGALQAWRAATAAEPGLETVPAPALEAFNRGELQAANARRLPNAQDRRAQWLQALDSYEEVITAAPGFARVWLRQAEAHMALARSPGEDFAVRRERARASLERARRLAPEDRELRAAELQMLAHLDRDPVRLVEAGLALLSEHPDDTQTAGLVADALSDLGRWAERRELTAELTKRNPQEAQAWRLHARSLTALRDFEVARRAYDESIRVSHEPEMETHIERAQLEIHEEGNLAAFVAVLDRYDPLFSRNARWNYQRWWWSLAHGDHLAAIETVERASVTDWPTGQKDLMLGIAWRAGGDAERADRFLGAGLNAIQDDALRPTDPAGVRDHHLQLALIHALRNDAAAARESIAALETYLATRPVDREAKAIRVFLASALGMLGEPQRAVAHLRIALDQPDWRFSPQVIWWHCYNRPLRDDAGFRTLMAEHGVGTGA